MPQKKPNQIVDIFDLINEAKDKKQWLINNKNNRVLSPNQIRYLIKIENKEFNVSDWELINPSKKMLELINAMEQDTRQIQFLDQRIKANNQQFLGMVKEYFNSAE